MKIKKVACIGLLFGSLSLTAMEVETLTKRNDAKEKDITILVSDLLTPNKQYPNEEYQISFNRHSPNTIKVLYMYFNGSSLKVDNITIKRILQKNASESFLETEIHPDCSCIKNITKYYYLDQNNTPTTNITRTYA